MSSAIVSTIVISGITEGYTSEYIANVLWKQGLAQVSRITMLPYLEHESNTMCFTAYADIQQWADTEAAFNFIKRLEHTFVARIVHNDDDSWHVRSNTRYNANNNAHLYAYATHFDTQYFYSPFEKGEENTLPVGENQKQPFKQTATQELEDIDLELEQDMQDLLYDIEEHERLTEDEYDQLFQRFGQDEDDDEDDDDNDNEDTEQDIEDIEHYLHESNIIRTTTQNIQYLEEPDYDYIQHILDRIDNNRIHCMEQGLGIYTLF
jgi:hypothetical protein